MNRLEYLTALRRRLEEGGLAEDEINDALSFYEEIFLDAGSAHEAETAANLGTPEELANKILQDSGIHAQGDAVFQMESATDPSAAQSAEPDSRPQSGSLAKLIVLIITSPIWFSIMCALAAVALAILAALISIIITVFVVGFSLTIGGIDNKAGLIKVLDANGAVMSVMDKDGIMTNGKYTCGSDAFGRYAEISGGEIKLMKADKTVIGEMFARSDNVLILQAGDVEIRILKDTKECYIDADTFGVNGSAGLTGRVEYSDDTYADYVGGILVGGKSKEGDF